MPRVAGTPGTIRPMPSPWLRDLENLLDAELEQGAATGPFRPAILRWAAANDRPVDPCRWSRRSRPAASVVGAVPGAIAGASRLPGGSPLTSASGGGRRSARSSSAMAGQAGGAALGATGPGRACRVAGHVGRGAMTGSTWLPGPGTCWPRPSPRSRTTWRCGWPVGTPGATPSCLGLRQASAGAHAGPGPGLAIGARYAARAARTGGLVQGRSYPFFDIPLPSATAHLAAAAARTGEGLEVVARAVEWLRAERRRDGGWGDPRQPTDLLTTLAVAELLGALDASFEPASVLDVMGAGRGAGRPSGAGGAGVALVGRRDPRLRRVERQAVPRAVPLAARPDLDDRAPLQGAPQGGIGIDARLLGELPGLSALPIECGFIDLAGFGMWNTTHGQDAGDQLLALCSGSCARSPTHA